jgi:hypothetical protein
LGLERRLADVYATTSASTTPSQPPRRRDDVPSYRASCERCCVRPTRSGQRPRALNNDSPSPTARAGRGRTHRAGRPVLSAIDKESIDSYSRSDSGSRCRRNAPRSSLLGRRWRGRS